jgi:tetratricopeptide (TPR) repeat protein
VPLQDFDGLGAIWTEYDRLADRSWLGVGVSDLEEALVAHSLTLAHRVVADYRAPQPTVRENQWLAARDALVRALPHSSDRHLRAVLRYTEGHLHRINGEAHKSRRQMADAQEDLNQAVIAFREAAALDSRWPDPFLGLARTFIYGLDDVELGADAFEQAKRRGHSLNDRETAQLAEGYRDRGEQLERTAGDLDGLPQQIEYLTKAIDAYKRSAALYASIADYGNAASGLRLTQLRQQRAELRLADLQRPSRLGPPWE